jgi:hypothetical protein
MHSKKDCGCVEGKKWVQHHIDKEICTVVVVFPLFCPTPIHMSVPCLIKVNNIYFLNDNVLFYL